MPVPPRFDRRSLLRWWRPAAVVCAALSAGVAVAALRPPAPETVAVAVAARDLDAREPLAAGDVEARAMPAAHVPDDALGAEEGLSGRSLTGPMNRGEVLTTARVADAAAGEYGADRVAAPVRVADAEVAALITPGMRIDVLAAAGEWEAAGAAAARVVARDCPVLAVGGGESAAVGMLLVAVTEEQARDLAAESATSALSVTIRGQ